MNAPTRPPRAVSVTQAGEPDGFEIVAGYHAEVDFSGTTRLMLSVPTAFLERVHRDLVKQLDPPLGLLYRQKVDRRSPRPEGAPPVDFVSLELRPQRVLDALAACAGLVYHDARAEIWVRGRGGEQVILDPDGVLFCYPDDPSFRDVARMYGLSDGKVETLLERDYVRHHFDAANDALEDRLIEILGLERM